MRRALTLLVVASLLVGLSASVGQAQVRYYTWKTAAEAARREGKIVLAIYSGGGHLLFTIASEEIRALGDKYYVILEQNYNHLESGWEQFEGKVQSRCLFATPDAEVLAEVPSDANTRKFTAILKEAVAKAKEIADAKQKVADEEAKKHVPLKARLDEAEKLIRQWDYKGALIGLEWVLQTAEKKDWPEPKRAMALKEKLLKRADFLVQTAEEKLKAGMPILAFRNLDEAAHLFDGLVVASEAAKRLVELLADAKYADAAAAYREERKVYDLYTQAMEAEARKDFSAAAEPLGQIADNHKESPVWERASLHLKICRGAAQEEAKSAPPDKTMDQKPADDGSKKPADGGSSKPANQSSPGPASGSRAAPPADSKSAPGPSDGSSGGSSGASSGGSAGSSGSGASSDDGPMELP